RVRMLARPAATRTPAAETTSDGLDRTVKGACTSPCTACASGQAVTLSRRGERCPCEAGRRLAIRPAPAALWNCTRDARTAPAAARARAPRPRRGCARRAVREAGRGGRVRRHLGERLRDLGGPGGP